MGPWGKRTKSFDFELKSDVPVEARYEEGEVEGFPTWHMTWGPVDVVFDGKAPPWAEDEEPATDAQQAFARRLGLDAKGHGKESLSILIAHKLKEDEPPTDWLKDRFLTIELDGKKRPPKLRWQARHIVSAVDWTISRARWRCPTCKRWTVEPQESQCDCGAMFEHHVTATFAVTVPTPDQSPAPVPKPAATHVPSVPPRAPRKPIPWGAIARATAHLIQRGAALILRVLRTQNRWSTASMVIAGVVVLASLFGARWVAVVAYVPLFACAVVAALTFIKNGHGLLHAIGAVVVATAAVGLSLAS